jgi:predicted ATPase/DNA-binding SARP family transcriptional activator
MSDRAPAPLVIHLFGPFEVYLNDVPLPRLRSRKGQWLLALLTLRAGRELGRLWLAGTLWPNSPEPQALASLRISLNDLRRALGAAADRLGAPTTQTLCLDLTGAEVDVLAFDQAVTRAARDPLRGEPALEAAIALYRGPLLEGWMEEWVFQERQAREQTYLGALETLAGRALASGEPAAAVRHLRRALAVDPLTDTAQRALMQALAASGDYAAATQVYRDFRLLLHRELNAQPAPDTETLYQQLRAEARRMAETAGERRQSTDGQDQGRSHPLAGRPSPAGRRPSLIPEGTLTFLFTDIEGSTRLWEEHPEAMRLALARHDGLLHGAIAAHAGVLFKSMGDQICAAFPRVPDALGAALAAQRALQAELWEEVGPLRVRMALHTGAAEERQGDYFGPPLNRIARLLEAGHGGQVLLSLATQELARDHLPEGASLRDLGEHRLKDLVRPERIFQFVAPDLPADFPPLNTLDLRPNNLPAQSTPLLGREQEVAAAGERLRSEAVRLLTLTGPGGTGKTRLGLQVAADLLDAFESGVYFVGLAPISDPHLVASRIAQSLGVRETPGQPLLESLRQSLRERQMLLLLDNFEHVLAAAPLVAELLAGCPRLKVLVTSRAPLHLQGEQEFPVPPLALPDRKRLPPLDCLSRYAAVALFIQQARGVKPEFAVTNENAPSVAEICHRLDGLPLAIVLAAARIKLFPPLTLLRRMASRLTLLTGGARDQPARHQTLRGAIAWSYDLLDEGERWLFRRLSVFVGGFTLDAAEAVCNAEDELNIDLLEGVASLLDKSLLQQEPGTEEEPRFGMLETIREYGRECLAASGEAEILHRRHAEFFTAFAEETAPRLLSAQRSRWLARLEAEHDNLRAAFDGCQAARSPLALRLAGSLFWFWNFGAHFKEGWRRAQEALNVAEERTAAARAGTLGRGHSRADTGGSSRPLPTGGECRPLARSRRPSGAGLFPQRVRGGHLLWRRPPRGALPH